MTIPTKTYDYPQKTRQELIMETEQFLPSLVIYIILTIMNKVDQKISIIYLQFHPTSSIHISLQKQYNFDLFINDDVHFY